MATTQSSTKTTEDFVALWTDLASDVWQQTVKNFDIPIPTLPPPSIPWPDHRKYKENKTFKFLETAFKNVTTGFNLLTPSQETDSHLDNLVSASEFSTQMALDSFENIIEFQTEWVGRLSRIGEHTQAYGFDDIDPGIFESFRRLYHQEIQKYFLIPQLGLPRYFQEKFNRFIDTANLFHSYLAELIYLLGVAFEKSNRVMQENLNDMMVDGEIFENPDKGYEQWIKTLEAHLMILLQSSEYIKVLDNTIASFSEFKKARDDLLCQVLKPFPIPSNQEMDAVYKELYTIKKRLNQLSKKKRTEKH